MIQNQKIPNIPSEYSQRFFFKDGFLCLSSTQEIVCSIHSAARFPLKICEVTQCTAYFFDTPRGRGHVILHWHEIDLSDE